MSRLRWPLLLGILVVSAVLGYALRDLVYQLVVVPIAYLLWLLYFYYSAIPQWAIWILLVSVLLIAVLWSLVPEAPRRRRGPRVRTRAQGDVEALAVWIRKSRRGNYFKWQLANRIGRIARRIGDLSGSRGRPPSADEAVERYLDAGLNYSFVDFPTARGRFTRAPQTPLDVDPQRVADYLETLMEKSSGRSG